MGQGTSAATIGSVAKAVGKSLALSAAVVAASLAVWQATPLGGSMVLLLGSFIQVASGYRKEWRLLWLTCLLAPFASALAYVVQLGLMPVRPRLQFLLPVVALGLAAGWLRGRAHEVFARGNQVFAQRTVWYLIIWLVCFGVSQVFALARATELLAFGLLSGAFSTAVLAAMSLVIVAKYRKQCRLLRAPGHAGMIAGITLLITVCSFIIVPSSHAHGPRELLDRIMPAGDIPAGFQPQGEGKDEPNQAHQTYLRLQSQQAFTQINLKVMQYPSAELALAVGRDNASVFSRSEGDTKRSAETLSLGDFSYLSNQSVEMSTQGSADRSRFRAYIALAEVYRGSLSYSVAIWSRSELDPSGVRQMALDIITKMDRAYTVSIGGGIAGPGSVISESVSGSGGSREAAEEVAIASAIIAILTALGVSAANAAASASAGAAQSAADAVAAMAPVEETDSKNVSGQEAIDELVKGGARTVIGLDGKVWVVEPLAELPPDISGIAYTKTKQIPDPSDPSRTIGVLDPTSIGITKEWKRPPLWRGEQRTTTETWFPPGSDLAGGLVGIGFTPRTIRGTDGRIYVIPPDNSPDNVAGSAWRGKRIKDAAGNDVDVIDPDSPVMVEHWPQRSPSTTNLPPETEPDPDGEPSPSRMKPAEKSPAPKATPASSSDNTPIGAEGGVPHVPNPSDPQPQPVKPMPPQPDDRPTDETSGDASSGLSLPIAVMAVGLVATLGAGALATAAAIGSGALLEKVGEILGGGVAGATVGGGAPGVSATPGDNAGTLQSSQPDHTAVGKQDGAGSGPSTQSPVPDVITRQQKEDSCAIASARHMAEAITGESLTEEQMRELSSRMRDGYQRHGGWGTTTKGMKDLLTNLGIDAQDGNMSLAEIRQALADGKQVSVSFWNPQGYNHRVVVQSVTKVGTVDLGWAGEKSHDLYEMTILDPATGKASTRPDFWWQVQGNKDGTIVAQSLEKWMRSLPTSGQKP